MPIVPVYSFHAESLSFGLIPCLFVPCWTDSGKALPLCNRSRSSILSDFSPQPRPNLQNSLESGFPAGFIAQRNPLDASGGFQGQRFWARCGVGWNALPESGVRRPFRGIGRMTALSFHEDSTIARRRNFQGLICYRSIISTIYSRVHDRDSLLPYCVWMNIVFASNRFR
jgi:hypothetical protein